MIPLFVLALQLNRVLDLVMSYTPSFLQDLSYWVLNLLGYHSFTFSFEGTSVNTWVLHTSFLIPIAVMVTPSLSVGSVEC